MKSKINVNGTFGIIGGLLVIAGTIATVSILPQATQALLQVTRWTPK